MRDDSERFQPLGPAIKPEQKKPDPRPVEVAPNVYQKPDGTLETRGYLPPPPAKFMSWGEQSARILVAGLQEE